MVERDVSSGKPQAVPHGTLSRGGSSKRGVEIEGEESNNGNSPGKASRKKRKCEGVSFRRSLRKNKNKKR